MNYYHCQSPNLIRTQVPCSCFNPGSALLNRRSTPNLPFGVKRTNCFFLVHKTDGMSEDPLCIVRACGLLFCTKAKPLDGYILKIGLLPVVEDLVCPQHRKQRQNQNIVACKARVKEEFEHIKTD